MYLLIALVVSTYSPTGTEQLELVDSITDRNECLLLAHEFRKEEVFKQATFKCVRTTISVEAK